MSAAEKAAATAGLLSAVPPLVPGDWLAVEPEAAQSILRRLPAPFGRPARTALRVRSVAFFPGWALLETVERRAGADRVQRAALLGAERFVPLEGLAAPLHEIRAEGFAPGSGEGALDYLRLFTTACRSERGRFHLVTAPADLSAGERVAPAACDILRAALLEPVGVEEVATGWEIRARLFHGADLFDATFAVARDGACEMLEDRLLAEGALARCEDWSGEALRFEAPEREADHGR